jgi:mevalonate kinase
LLLGEHIVLRGGRALAIPYPRFGARWVQADAADERLTAFAEYLATHFSAADIDVAAFRQSVADGLRLHSDIPVGYGLGSSGTVCAAVLDRFGTPASKALALPALQDLLARMEGHFHGNSSGTDPLIVFRRRPLLLGGPAIEEPTLPALAAPYRFFLLDTGVSRSTSTYVGRFLNRYDHAPDDRFVRRTRTMWLPANARALAALLAGRGDDLWAACVELSAIQAELVPDFIPEPVQAVWRGGDHILKLCGAGGGGCMLGLSRDWAATEAALRAAGFTVYSVPLGEVGGGS